MPATNPSQPPQNEMAPNLSAAAWEALRENNWQKALKIIPHIDFSLDDIHHFRLLCCTYLQSQQWRALSAVASIATEHFPSEPIFWESWAWAEYIQGNVKAALQILESVIPVFCHRETTAYILAFLYTSQNMPSDAAHWLDLAARLASESRATRSRTNLETGLISPLLQSQIYFPV